MANDKNTASHKVWKGTLSFGLVSIPCALFAAAREERVSFNQLHAACKNRLKQQPMICPSCNNQAVEKAEIVKGYEVADGRFIVVSADEIKSAEPESTRQLEITEFVPAGQVDPVYFESSFFLGIEEGGEKAYSLVCEAMAVKGMVALAKLFYSGKEHIAVIRPVPGGLMLHTLFWDYEVRAFDFPALPGTGWNVTARYGRRGGNLTTDPKMVNGDYEEAVKSYNRCKREKLGKGYREAAGTSAAAPEFAPVLDTAVMPKVEVELLTPIEVADIGRYILDDRYWLQEKADGDRSPVRRDGDSFTRYNRKGEAKPLPASLAALLSKTHSKQWLLDGEIEGETLWLFSALEADGVDWRTFSFAGRYRTAQRICGDIQDQRLVMPPKSASVKLLPIAYTTQEKEQFVRDLVAANAEGVVIIDSYAPFKPGRAGQHFKLKFVKTATVRVRGHHKDGKRSVEIELWSTAPGCDDSIWIPFGHVSIPEKYGPLPAPGTLIEVRYLYAHRGDHRGGALNQPVYLRQRDDLDSSAATVEQLKFKRGEL